MFVTTRCDWHLLFGSKEREGEDILALNETTGKTVDVIMMDGQTKVILPAGRYEVERIPNPRGSGGSWLVLKGTLIGSAEGWWHSWSEMKTAEYNITVEE